MVKTFRLNTGIRRSLISSLFGFTFFASIITVSASNILPCPAKKSFIHLAESDGDVRGVAERRKVIVEKRPRRWMEEKRPS